MTKETFMLVSLKEDKAKKLAQAISSPTCRKILDYLANKEATETEIADKLKIPISTVHYNLSQLKESKLVETEEFHYSKKGKEVLHYKLANKYIIIAPKESSASLLESLKTLLPVVGIIAAGVGVWNYVSHKATETVAATATFAQEAAPEAMLYAKSAAMDAVPTLISEPVVQSAWPTFVYGALTALILYIAIEFIRKK